MLKEDAIKRDIEKIEDKTINEACELLSRYYESIDKYLLNVVAELCDIEPRILLYDTKKVKAVHSRWFYWYVYRYMTNESYDEISKHSSHYRKFATTCVCNAVAQMSVMVSSEAIWKKRWLIAKNIVDIVLENRAIKQENVQPTVTVRVSSPHGVNVELKKD